MNDVGNQEIGEVVRRLRGDTPQDALASRMRSRGHEKWSQSTVWAVEKGDRPLRLTEAVSLAEVLGVLLEDLVEPREGEVRYQQSIARAKAELEAVAAGIERRIKKLDHDSLVDEVKKAQRRWGASQERPEGRDDGQHPEA